MLTSEIGSIGRFFKHSVIYGFGSILNRATALILLPIYTNYLSVAEYGILELLYIIGTVFSGLLSIGIAHATLRFYYEYETDQERNAVITTSLIASLVISCSGVLFFGIWYQPLAHYILGSPAHSQGVLIVLVTLVFELSSQVCLAYLRAKEYSIFFVIVMFCKLIIQLIANTYFVVFKDMGVEGVLLGNLLAVAFGWLALTIFVIRECGIQFDWPKAVQTLNYSFPFLLNSIVGMISPNIDRFLITNLLSFDALGIYALALKFSGLLDNLIGEPFNRSYGAFRFSIMKSEDAGKIQAKIVRYLLIGLSVLSIGIIYFASDLLKVMSNPDYWPAANILPLLMVGSLLRVIAYPVQTGILYEKKTRHVFYIGLLSAVMSSIANFIFIQWLGLVGSCIAFALTSTITLIVTNNISQRYFKVSYEYRRLLIIIAITVIFYAIFWVLVKNFMYLNIYMKLILYMVFIVVLIYSGSLNKREIAWFQSRLLRIFYEHQTNR